MRESAAIPELHAGQMRVSARVLEWKAWDSVADLWDSLAAASPHRSFFVSSGWVRRWLEVYGPVLNPAIAVFSAAQAPVAACLLSPASERRWNLPVGRLYLNTAGERDSDSACVEFNTFICLPGWERAAAEAFWACVRPMPWDEVAFTACTPGSAVNALVEAAAPLHVTRTGTPAYFVDLGAVRAAGSDYERTLSPALRQQIRRSLRLYGEAGEVRCELPHDTSQALAFYEEMARLHNETWRRRGREGAFDSPLFHSFHRRCVEALFERGNIGLFRISAGDAPIGILYAFIDSGRVYYYQSGFHYSADNRLKPGLVSHRLIVGHCIAAGLDEYHFMAGQAPYKRSLANGAASLEWIRIERGLKMSLVRRLRPLKRSVMRLSRVRAGTAPQQRET